MSVIAIIFLVLRLLLALPSEIATLKAIIALLPGFKGASFREILALVVEILKMIMGLVPLKPSQAKGYLGELKDQLSHPTTGMGDSGGLMALRDRIKAGDCSGVGCPPTTV